MLNFLRWRIFFQQKLPSTRIFLLHLLPNLNIKYMRQEFFIPSLFPQKGQFDPEDIKSKCLGTGLEESISIGMSEGLEKTNQVFSNGDLSTRLHGQFLHETIFNCICSQANSTMQEAPIFSTSIEGNKKCYFQFNGYVFILRKENVTPLETGPNQVIQNQEADAHVITINYSLDSLRENIQSISLQYVEGKNTIWHYSIPTNTCTLDSESNIEVPEKEHKKPRLKPGIKSLKSHEAI